MLKFISRYFVFSFSPLCHYTHHCLVFLLLQLSTLLLNPNPNWRGKKHTMNYLHFCILLLSALSFSTQLRITHSFESVTIYDLLKAYNLPRGLFPKGVKDFSFDDSGSFQVYLDQPCNSMYENELHYDRNISGVLSLGQIDQLSGISAKDLFLWFQVKEIRVDIPSSGLIYFDVGVVSKQFSLSSFETPKECLAVQFSDSRVIVQQPPAAKVYAHWFLDLSNYISCNDLWLNVYHLASKLLGLQFVLFLVRNVWLLKNEFTTLGWFLCVRKFMVFLFSCLSFRVCVYYWIWGLSSCYWCC